LILSSVIILLSGLHHAQASSVSDKEVSFSIPLASSNGVARSLQTAEVSPPTLPAAAGAPSTESEQASESTYLIGPFDTLRITVSGHPDLSRTSIVRPDGRITIPLAEDVIAANKTPQQLARDLEEELRSTIRDPQVVVDVVEPVGPSAQRIKVIGSVGQMSALRYREGMTLLDVVIEAGGLSPFAAANDAVVYRRTPSATEEIPVRLGDLVGGGDQTANIAMRPGDVVMIPEGFFTGEWDATGSLTFSTAFSDNYNLDPDGQKDPAVIFTVTPGINVRGQTARVNAALAASVALEYRTISDPKADAAVNLTGTSNSELVRERLFLDANASVSQQSLSSSRGTSQSGSNSDQATVSTVEISPYLLNRLGSFANVETRHLFGAQFSSRKNDRGRGGGNKQDGQLSDSITNVFSIGLGSGRDFTRFLWTNRAYVGRQTRFDASDVDGAGVVFSPEFVLKPGFSLLGDLGYEVLDDGDENLSGPTALGGFDWRPSPTFSVRAVYGKQLENNAGEGSLRYEIGPRTTLVGTASERVQTGQQSLLQTTGSLGVNPATGQFVDRRTGLAFNPRPQTVNTNDNLSRTRRGSLNLSHASGLNTFGLSAFATDQKDLDNNNNNGSSGDDQTTWGVSASWSRQIDLRTGLTLTAGYLKGDGDNSGNNNNNQSGDKFDRYNFSIAVNRTINESLQGFVRYGFQKQTSPNKRDEFTENAVIVGLTYGFDL